MTLTQPIDGIFQPLFKHVVHIYRLWQTIYSDFKRDVKAPNTFVCVDEKSSVEASDSFIVDQIIQKNLQDRLC